MWLFLEERNRVAVKLLNALGAGSGDSDPLLD